MSATDQAFMKAYEQKQTVASGRKPKQAERRAPSQSQRTVASHPAPGRMSLAELYASPEARQRTGHQTSAVGVSRKAEPGSPAGVSIIQADAPATSPDTLVDASTANQLDQMVGPQDGPIQDVSHYQTSSADFRPDSPHVMMPPAPHAQFDDAEAIPLRGPDFVYTESSTESFVAAGVMSEPTAASVTASEPFRAQWEVDHFQWPTVVNQLITTHSRPLSKIVDRLLSGHHGGKNVVAISSFARGEGRTTLALCLAKLAATRGISVALVDGDRDRPRVAGQLGMSAEVGWDDTVQDGSPLSEAAIQSMEDGLIVLPWRGTTTNGDAALARQAAKALAELSSCCELVLIDVGPMFEAARFWFRGHAASAIHNALLLRDVRSTTEHQLADVVDRLDSADVHVFGVAENFEVQPRSKVSGYAS